MRPEPSASAAACNSNEEAAGRTELDPADTVSIRRRCERIVPSLKEALVRAGPGPPARTRGGGAGPKGRVPGRGTFGRACAATCPAQRAPLALWPRSRRP